MTVNVLNLIIFIISFTIILSFYYNKLLSIDEGENKKIKMLKRVLLCIIVMGFINIFSITEDVDIKKFLIVVFAVVVNIYTVVHSTKHCNFPKLFVIRLSLISAGITIALAGILWYSYSNTLFGFMFLNDEIDGVREINDSVFDSIILDSDGNTLSREEQICPESGSDTYNNEMSKLTLKEQNDCLEKEVRADLADQ
tara:strand:+ start:298 stop:888 length:591 start_codon:yes stop_codon:yes gene_type:complete